MYSAFGRFAVSNACIPENAHAGIAVSSLVTSDISPAIKASRFAPVSIVAMSSANSSNPSRPSTIPPLAVIASAILLLAVCSL